MKAWQIEELKKLLKLRNEEKRGDRMKMTVTHEISFPQIEMRDPLWFWGEAAKQVNSELTKLEEMIRELLLSKTRTDWLKFKNKKCKK